MNVIFLSDQKGKTVIQCPEIGPKHKIKFDRGRCITSDKREIRRLLSDEYARRYTRLAPNQDLQAISDYLESDNKPDTMTKEFLNSIPFNAWKEIFEIRKDIDAEFPMVGLAKATLLDQPMDPHIEQIAQRYNEGGESSKVETTDEEVETEEEPVKKKITIVTKKETEDESVDEEVETEDDEKVTSKDFNVRDAIAYMTGKTAEDLEGFIAEDEDRVSLITKWNDKFPDHQIEPN